MTYSPWRIDPSVGICYQRRIDDITTARMLQNHESIHSAGVLTSIAHANRATGVRS
jgi:hypothetical protein